MTSLSPSAKTRSVALAALRAAGWFACAVAAGWMEPAVAAPKIPMMYTSNYSVVNTKPIGGGPSLRQNTMNQSVTLNSSLGRIRSTGQTLNMSFSQAQATMPGNRDTNSSLGINLMTAGSGFNHIINYSQVENAKHSPGQNGQTRAESLSMMTSMYWRKLPSTSLSYNRFEEIGRRSESMQMSSNMRIGGSANMSFSQTQTKSVSQTSPIVSGNNASLNLSKQFRDRKHFSMSAVAGMNSSSSETGGVRASRNQSKTVSIFVVDRHIRRAPMTINFSMQNSVTTGQGNRKNTTSGQGVNAFTAIALPAAIKMDVSYSGSTSSSQGSRSGSRSINVNTVRDFKRGMRAGYSHSALLKTGGSRDDSLFYQITTRNGTRIEYRNGWSRSGGSQTSNYMSLGFQAILPGHMSTSYQYLQSHAGDTQKSQTLSINAPLGPSISSTFTAARRRNRSNHDESEGMSFSFPLSRSSSLSSAVSRQRSNGKTQMRSLSANISTAMPYRITINNTFSFTDDTRNKTTAFSISANTVF